MSCCPIDCSSESWSDRHKPRDEGREDVFSCACRHDRVRRATHGRSVVCEEDDDRVEEISRIVGEIAFEPELSDHAGDRSIGDTVIDFCSTIEEIISAFIRNRRSELGRLSVLDLSKSFGDFCGSLRIIFDDP